jgi:hypothetical protein
MLIPVRRVRVASPGDVRDASRQIVVHPYTRAIYVRMTDEEVREHQERRGR